MRRLEKSDWLVVALLVMLGVVGRLFRPDWNFTPLAAIALFGGFYFGRVWLAAAVVLVAIAASNLFEPAHNNWLVALSVYACLALPAVLGKWLPKSGSLRRLVPTWLVACIVPSLLFFIVTNMAVWLSSSQYAMSVSGLAECFALAAHFYRNMLAGDLFWTATLFGSWAWATRGERQLAATR